MGWKEDFNWGLAAFGLKIPDRLPLDEWGSRLTESPLRNSAALVGLSAVAFYAVEKNHNPKVRDLYDAMVYTSTCLSVGYGEIFPRTPAGKMIGTLLMTLGPSLASMALEGPAGERRDQMQEEMLAALRQILSRLPIKLAPSSGVAPVADGAEGFNEEA